MIRVLSFDPGKTTGWAVGETATFDTLTLLEVGQFHQDDCVPTIDELVKRFQPNWIVYEGFRLYEGMAQKLVFDDFPAVHVIGVIHACAWLSPPAASEKPLLAMQMATVRKSVRLLDAHASYFVGKRHAKDAYLHLRYFYVRNRKKLFS